MTHFESKIQQHISKLQSTPAGLLEAEVTRKRLDWFAEHAAEYAALTPTPRRAYEFLFRDYMGLDLADLPVIEECEDEIVWLSRNPCPTLEACIRAGLETRFVCRAVYERSTQALISCVDPQLRFLRSYTEIRPHAEHCRERLARLDFQAALTAADEEARRAVDQEAALQGAVVFLGRRLLGRSGGLQAAALSIRQSLEILGEENLTGAVLFCTPEPSPELFEAAAAAAITSVVWRAGLTWVESFPAFPTGLDPAALRLRK